MMVAMAIQYSNMYGMKGCPNIPAQTYLTKHFYYHPQRNNRKKICTKNDDIWIRFHGTGVGWGGMGWGGVGWAENLEPHLMKVAEKKNVLLRMQRSWSGVGVVGPS